MRAISQGHLYFTVAAVFFLSLSILCRIMEGMLLKKLIREAENMSATKNKLLKQCKLKFINCYELNNGAVNVEVFVEKFMQGIRFGRCSLRMIGIFSVQFLALSLSADAIGSLLGILYGETPGSILPYFLLAFLSLYFYFSISGVADVPGKEKALKTTIVDFLENRLAERIKSVKKDTVYLENEEEKAQRPKTLSKDNKTDSELKELLKEFLA